jgi:hypothetical protein
MQRARIDAMIRAGYLEDQAERAERLAHIDRLAAECHAATHRCPTRRFRP